MVNEKLPENQNRNPLKELMEVSLSVGDQIRAENEEASKILDGIAINAVVEEINLQGEENEKP